MNCITSKDLKRAAGGENDADVLARAIWSRVTEPADPVLGALLSVLGPIEALEWISALARRSTTPSEQIPAGLRSLAPDMRARIHRAVTRWQPRLVDIDTGREMRAIANFDGYLVTPSHAQWHPGLMDLGFETPACLWVRGTGNLAQMMNRSVAIVGARAATAYGEEATAQLTTGLGERGFTIISGGAYGIDITAQRVAVALDVPTVAVMASGADRMYPRGNAHVLERSLATGLVISEHPPGSAPTRARFLTRNRLIAALARAVIVVEAANRSGAISTARHAVKLGRPLGAVPGPITSMMSAGSHELMRSEHAVCITDAKEAAELAGNIGEDLAPPVAVQETLFDTLTKSEAAITEALPKRNAAASASIARTAGLSIDETISTLARLELKEIARREGSLWRRM